MGLIIRALLATAGALAGLVVARDAPNFGVVQGMTVLVLVALVVLALAVFRK